MGVFMSANNHFDFPPIDLSSQLQKQGEFEQVAKEGQVDGRVVEQIQRDSQSTTSSKASNVFKHVIGCIGHVICSGIKKASQFVDTYLINKIKQAVRFIFGASSSPSQPTVDQSVVVPNPPRLAPEVHKEIAPPLVHKKGEDPEGRVHKDKGQPALGKGAYGEVVHVRGVNNQVMKKALPVDNPEGLKGEYAIGARLDHPNLVKIHALQIKEYEGGEAKHKLVMDKIEGKPLDHYRLGSEKLSQTQFLRLMDQAKECCTYLYDQNVYWGDVNNGNIFVEGETNAPTLRLCDYGNWREERDIDKKAKGLLLGAMELTGWLVRGAAQIRDNDIKYGIIHPQAFFDAEIKHQILTADFRHPDRAPIPGADLHDEKVWMQAMMARIKEMKSDDEIKAFLGAYFDAVKEAFVQAMPQIEEQNRV